MVVMEKKTQMSVNQIVIDCCISAQENFQIYFFQSYFVKHFPSVVRSFGLDYLNLREIIKLNNDSTTLTTPAFQMNKTQANSEKKCQTCL